MFLLGTCSRCTLKAIKRCPPLKLHKQFLRNKEQVTCITKLKYSLQSNLNSLKNENNKIEINGKFYETDEWTNITPNIIQALDKKLYKQENHPLCIIKNVGIHSLYIY